MARHASKSNGSDSSRIAHGVLIALVLFLAAPLRSDCQKPNAPDTLTVRSGALSLRALVWRPQTRDPAPAVLFSHGSYEISDSLDMLQAAGLGPVFARHGYVFYLLFRRGVGLSSEQGKSGGEVMARAMAAGGVAARNSAQMQQLDAEFEEAIAGLALLRSMPAVDAKRIAIVGHSFGGSLTLLLAARDTTFRAVIDVGGAAGSWDGSPELRLLLLEAVGRVAAPVLFLHTANDYSTAPGKALSAEMNRLKKPNELKIYPAFGRTARDGHNFIFRDTSLWERDVFAFLDRYMSPR